ncbi:hypothetical protein [Candidatus Nitronereus thalassa]|uniref:HNH endonuclease n=1 Tax=Candidatus Nitronereus thalassa TaxID=3020898 RepID=A0ABU3K383_9BACT|nr:hypothetical protein [Candidatus Nitronereus thalassa]MDT7040851.1 hypothetical protein [Candidatus Nitronereus thalassa]
MPREGVTRTVRQGTLFIGDRPVGQVVISLDPASGPDRMGRVRIPVPRISWGTVIGRVVREHRPPHRPIARLYSGNADLSNLLALSQMAMGVPEDHVRGDVADGWFKVRETYARWVRECGIAIEYDMVKPFAPEADDEDLAPSHVMTRHAMAFCGRVEDV